MQLGEGTEPRGSAGEGMHHWPLLRDGNEQEDLSWWSSVQSWIPTAQLQIHPALSRETRGHFFLERTLVGEGPPFLTLVALPFSLQW